MNQISTFRNFLVLIVVGILFSSNVHAKACKTSSLKGVWHATYHTWNSSGQEFAPVCRLFIRSNGVLKNNSKCYLFWTDSEGTWYLPKNLRGKLKQSSSCYTWGALQLFDPISGVVLTGRVDGYASRQTNTLVLALDTGNYQTTSVTMTKR